MPALETFGKKWRVGSDDFVFPYIGSICLRFVWIVLIGVVMLNYDKDYHCDDERLLRTYLAVLIGAHFSMCLIEISVVLISARGTIANPAPRKRLPIALYVQSIVFILEFVWDIVGVLWAFDPTIDCSSSHSVLILARVILVWNLISSIVIGSYMIMRIGICRLCCRRPPKKLRYESLAPSMSFGGRILSALSTSSLNQHHRQRQWQWRLQCLFCCMKLRDHQKTVFSEVSTTLADVFTYLRGYVPSDIIAGMAILAMEQSVAKDAEWDVEQRNHKPLDFSCKSVCRHFSRVARYMKFAAGTYGWPFRVLQKGTFGCCRFLCSGRCSECCGSKHRSDCNAVEEFVAQGDRCGWHTRALKDITGLQDADIVYASFTSEVFCPAFFVAYDHQEEAVVVTIRGTITVKDVLTSMSAEPDILSTSELEDFFAHKGMMHSAHAVQLKLESQDILERAFEDHPTYHLVLVGHSVGAGVASLLAIILKPKYPKLHCYAYSPPGGIISMSAVPHTRPYITSTVVGNDFVARTNLQNLEAFSERILHCMQTCHLPKYRIFLDSFFYWLGICKPRVKDRVYSVSEMAIQREPLLNTNFEANFDEEENIYDVVADVLDAAHAEQQQQMTEKKLDPVTGKAKHLPRGRMPLFLPGRIIHITWGAPQSRCCGLWKYRPLQAHWTPQSEFSELVIEKNAIKHHMPATVFKTLQQLQKQQNHLSTP